jgi:FkbM family methyltransferase
MIMLFMRTYKQSIGKGLVAAFRIYIRYMPWRIAKPLLLRKIFEPYLGWRSFETTCRTRFGAVMEIRYPDTIQSAVHLFGVWEPHITQFVASSLRAGDVFVDVGANVGYYTLLASRLVGPDGAVHSIEASPNIFDALERNVLRNRLSNVHLHQCAVGEVEGTVVLYSGRETNLGATTVIKERAMQGHMREEAIVSSRIITHVVPLDALARARLIKIDVEGAEWSVIKPLVQELKHWKPATEWIIEIAADDNGAALVDSFKTAGYNAYRIANAYKWEAYLANPREASLTPLEPPFLETTDIVFSRDRLP